MNHNVFLKNTRAPQSRASPRKMKYLGGGDALFRIYM